MSVLGITGESKSQREWVSNHKSNNKLGWKEFELNLKKSR